VSIDQKLHPAIQKAVANDPTFKGQQTALARDVRQLHLFFDQFLRGVELEAERLDRDPRRAQKLRQTKLNQHAERRPTNDDQCGLGVQEDAGITAQHHRVKHDAERANQAQNRRQIHSATS